MEPVLQKLSVVLPCYNEAESIPQVIPRLLTVLEELQKESRLGAYEVIVVNDHSTDASVDLLSKHPQVQVLHNLSSEQGYGKALKEGFVKSQGDWIAFLDVDNSYRPEDLSQFVEAIEKTRADFIMGTRAFSEQGMSWVRGLGNWVYKVLARIMYGSNLRDVCSGYRVFHRRYLDEVVSIPENGLDFSIHLTLKMLRQEVAIHQIKIAYDERLGNSKLSVLVDGWNFFKALITLRLRSRRAFKPS